MEAVIFFGYLALCFGVGAYALSKGYVGWVFTILAILVSPLLIFIILALMKNKAEENARLADKQRLDEQDRENRKRDHEARMEELRMLTAAQKQRDQAAGGAPGPAEAPGVVSIAGELEKLAALKDRGVLTEEEFAAQKAAILKPAAAA